MTEKEFDNKLDRVNSVLDKARIYVQLSINKERGKKSVEKAKNSKIKSVSGKAHQKRGNFHEEEIEEKEIIKEEHNKIFTTHLTTQPSVLSSSLHLWPFQIDGLNWLINLYNLGINGILADEMGLGKTVQTISFLAYLKEFRGIDGPFLVVCPKSVISNWMKEFKNIFPTIICECLPGTREEREFVIETIIKKKKFNVLVTSYEGLKNAFSYLMKIEWEYFVVDEGHKLKNEESLISIVARGVTCKAKLLLTGTPLQNNLHELWSLLNFLLPEIFDDNEIFDELFVGQMEGLAPEEVERKNSEILVQLHKILSPFILRRLKSEVNLNLPSKKEIHIYIGLTPLQRQMYKDMITFHSIDGGNKTSYANICMQLKKICNHPYLFDGVEDEEEVWGEHLAKASGKMLLLDKLLKKLKEEGHQVLFFSQMTAMLDIIEDYCNFKQFDYCRIDGSTDLDTREEEIGNFTKPDTTKFIFLLSTRAGGLGLNLTSADTVILYDSDWNPQMDLQAMDRAHRIGQKRPVNVYRFITQGTIEEWINERQIVKLKFDSLVIQQGRSKTPHQPQKSGNYSKNDFKEMLEFGVSDIFKAENGTYKDEDIDEILKREEEKEDKRTKELEQYFEKHKNLLDLDDGYGRFNTLLFENENYSCKRDENSKLVQSLLKKRKEEEMDALLNASHQRIRTRARVETRDYSSSEEDKSAATKTKRSLDDYLNDEKIKRKVISNYHQYKLYKNRNRLLELAHKKEAYIHFNANQDNDEDFVIFPNEENEELESLIKTGLTDWKLRDFQKYCRFFETGKDKDDYESISKFIETKTVEQVKTFSDLFWEQIDEFPEKKKILRCITQSQQKKNFQQKIKSKVERDANYLDSEFKLKKTHLYNRPGKLKKEDIYHYFWIPEIDKYLIYFAFLTGYENVKAIKENFNHHPLFRTNNFIRTRTIKEFEERLKRLVTALEKEEQFEKEEKEKEEKEKEKEEKSNKKEQTEEQKEEKSNRKKGKHPLYTYFKVKSPKNETGGEQEKNSQAEVDLSFSEKKPLCNTSSKENDEIPKPMTSTNRKPPKKKVFKENSNNKASIDPLESAQGSNLMELAESTHSDPKNLQKNVETEGKTYSKKSKTTTSTLKQQRISSALKRKEGEKRRKVEEESMEREEKKLKVE